MIKIICTMFTVTIKDLKVYLDNLNLLIKKNVIEFEQLVLKKETDK